MRELLGDFIDQMENTDSQAKQTAVDNKSAYAGNVMPESEIGVDQLGERAGMDIQPETPLAVKDEFDQRDQNRYELDPDSAADHPTLNKPAS